MSCRSLHRMNTRKSCHGFSIAMVEYYTLNALEIRLDISSRMAGVKPAIRFHSMERLGRGCHFVVNSGFEKVLPFFC